MLEFMPAVLLTSKLCPKGIEATTYSLLAGYQNFGNAVSRSIGLYMINGFGIKTTEPCDFSHLALLVMISHMILPLASIPFTFCLIPNSKMTDDILEALPETPETRSIPLTSSFAGDSFGIEDASMMSDLGGVQGKPVLSS